MRNGNESNGFVSVNTGCMDWELKNTMSVAVNILLVLLNTEYDCRPCRPTGYHTSHPVKSPNGGWAVFMHARPTCVVVNKFHSPDLQAKYRIGCTQRC